MKKLILNLIILVVMAIKLDAFSDDLDRAVKLKLMQGEQRVAFVVGNNNYDSRYLTTLHNPINDARSIRDVLKSRGFDVVYGENLTARAMKKRLKKFYKKIRNGGVGFLYFSGHGMEFDGENYLIPVDAQLNEKADVELDAISISTITKKMIKAHNRLNILVLDACRNDPFAKGSGGGLSKIEPKGTFVAYATAAGKTASDGRRGGHGLFTKHLISYMKKEGLPLYQVFKRTREKVYKESHHKQFPAIYDQVVGEEFFFTLPKTQRVVSKSSYSFKTQKAKRYALTINTTPEDAKVQILNISSKYYDGIRLKKGSYTIKVSKSGYLSKQGSVELEDDLNIDVSLEKIKSTYTHKTTYNKNKNKDGWDKSIFRGKRSYSKNTTHTVKDNLTGLIWQKGHSASEKTWSEAKNYCKNLSLDGYSDWRLPSYNELYYLADRSKVDPAMDTRYFDESKGWYWTNTKRRLTSRIWIVNFYFGYSGYHPLSKRHYVRCVR